ncbi:hypothetical protein NC653_022258 [Populus alba x Populus x berolinensis]|uniref:Uncharacterized protein n=1 Tax=Populus alba x Populus x berolinensis TaxID=444605 RepID=A0AAD6MFR1_9ROSI|nr:hypothetical protein NC653_022258 [Populus alba x Populus x berolinensis]
MGGSHACFGRRKGICIFKYFCIQDCAVARFSGLQPSGNSSENLSLPTYQCASGKRWSIFSGPTFVTVRMKELWC